MLVSKEEKQKEENRIYISIRIYIKNITIYYIAMKYPMSSCAIVSYYLFFLKFENLESLRDLKTLQSV